MQVETEIRSRTSIPTFSSVSAAATVIADDGGPMAHESTRVQYCKQSVLIYVPAGRSSMARTRGSLEGDDFPRKISLYLSGVSSKASPIFRLKYCNFLSRSRSHYLWI